MNDGSWWDVPEKVAVSIKVGSDSKGRAKHLAKKDLENARAAAEAKAAEAKASEAKAAEAKKQLQKSAATGVVAAAPAAAAAVVVKPATGGGKKKPMSSCELVLLAEELCQKASKSGDARAIVVANYFRDTIRVLVRDPRFGNKVYISKELNDMLCENAFLPSTNCLVVTHPGVKDVKIYTFFEFFNIAKIFLGSAELVSLGSKICGAVITMTSDGKRSSASSAVVGAGGRAHKPCPQKLCHFHNTKNGCKNGPNCRYLHVDASGASAAE